MKAQIDDDIKKSVDDLDRNNGPDFDKHWLINQVELLHNEITGRDADFALLAIREYIARRVEAFFRNLKNLEIDPQDNQLSFNEPGYKKLQQWYLLEREGKQKGVRLQAMTDEEIDSKVASMRGMQDGLQEHIDELLHYKATRKIKPVG